MCSDSEGDRISILNECDFVIFHESGVNKIHAFLADESPSAPMSEPVLLSTQFNPFNVEATITAAPSAPENNGEHFYHHAVCDNCDLPIVGFRYKCVECADFDLCMKCEGKMIHKHHVMLRIANPSDVDLGRSKIFRRFSRLRRSDCTRHDEKKERHGKHNKHDQRQHQQQHSKHPTFFELLSSYRPSLADQATQANPTANASAQASTNTNGTSNASTQARPFTYISDIPKLISMGLTNAKNSPTGQCPAMKNGMDVLSNIAQNFATMMDPFAASFEMESNNNVATDNQNKNAAEKSKSTASNPPKTVTFADTQPEKQFEKQAQEKAQEPNKPEEPPKTTTDVGNIASVVTIEDVNDDDNNHNVEAVMEVEELRTDRISPSNDWTMVDKDGLIDSSKQSSGAIPKRLSVANEAAESAVAAAAGAYAAAQAAIKAQQNIEKSQFNDFARLLESHLRLTDNEAGNSSQLNQKSAENISHPALIQTLVAPPVVETIKPHSSK